jgi:hypothetical protein
MGVKGDMGDCRREGATCAASKRPKRLGQNEAATHSERMVGVAASVQDLHCNLSALRMDRTRHNAMMLYLMPKAQLRSEGTHAPCEIGRNSSGDDKTNTAARALSKVYLTEE